MENEGPDHTDITEHEAWAKVHRDSNLWGLPKGEGFNSVNPGTPGPGLGSTEEESSDLWSLLESQHQTGHKGWVEGPLWEAGF